MGSHRVVTMIVLVLFFSLILGACAETGTPVDSAESVNEPASNDQAGDPGAEPGSDLATAEAALDQSGKPGPTLPPGDLTLQPAPADATPMPDSPGVESKTGSAAPAQAAQAGDADATLSPEQLATLDSSLDSSGKPGEQPLEDAPSPPTSCLNGMAMILMPLAAFVFFRRKK